MNNPDTPEEIETALIEICAMRNIDVKPRAERIKRSYSQNQARLRDIEEKRIAAGEVDSDGSAIFIKNKQNSTPEQIAAARRNAKTTNFNRAFVVGRGEK